jgi:uncharacterized membrane protein
MEAQYRILFSGKLMPGQELHDVVRRVSAKFRMQEETARELVLQGSGRVLKQNLNAAAAERYRAALTAVGLVINIEPQAASSGNEPESFLRSYPIPAPGDPFRAKQRNAGSSARSRRVPQEDGWSLCPKCGVNEVSDLTGVCQACGVVVERYLANQGLAGGSAGGSPDNPYAPPQADLTPPMFDLDEDDLREPRSVPAGHGWSWIAEAWPLFREEPLAWIGAVVLFYLIVFGVSLVPFIGGIASALLGPMLSAGLMMGAHSQFRGDGFTVSHLFAGVSARPGPLALIGLMYLLYAVGMGIIMAIGLIAMSASSGLAMESGAFDPSSLDSVMSGTMLMLLVLFVLLLAMPLAMAMFFAPGLVALNDVPLMRSFKLSFRACLKNILSFLVFGLVAIVMVIAGILPFGLGLLLVLPILAISIYLAYRDIFYHG